MKKAFIPSIITVFVVLSAIFFYMKGAAPQFKFGLLMGANTIMATLSLAGYALVKKELNNRPEAFIRGVYSASFLKLFVCIISILIYVMVDKPNIHKPSLFVVFGIYAVYSIVETWMLSKLAREAK